MAIYHVGSPLCMFAYMRLSLFSRPKIDKLDEIHETSIVPIHALPFCAANLVKRNKLEVLYTTQVSPFKILRSLNLE